MPKACLAGARHSQQEEKGTREIADSDMVFLVFRFGIMSQVL